MSQVILVHQAQSCAQQRTALPAELADTMKHPLCLSDLLRLSFDRLKAAAHSAVLSVSHQLPEVPAQLLCAPLHSAVERLLQCLSTAPQLQHAASTLCKCHLKSSPGASQQLCVPLQMHTMACGTPAATCQIPCLATT